MNPAGVRLLIANKDKSSALRPESARGLRCHQLVEDPRFPALTSGCRAGVGAKTVLYIGVEIVSS